MAYKISNVDFFKQNLKEDIKKEEIISKVEESIEKQEQLLKVEEVKVNPAVESMLMDSENLLNMMGFQGLALEVAKLRKSAKRERFTVAVVGEFSRGKSTFINKLLNKDFLPVSDLPTTSLLTRIRHSKKEVLLAFNEKNEKVFERPLVEESWTDLVVQNFGGEEFKGTTLTGVNAEWLEASNIELIDTPGAGDLSEQRAKVIGDALLGCDGAIITISATSPLSLSEKLFIEERLLARKMPNMLLIITKLDTIPMEERVGMIRYIQNKLKSWNMDIPVYVPYPVELSDSSCDDMVGMDQIKDEMLRWVANPERTQLVQSWLLEKTADILNHAISSLEEKKFVLEESDKEKRELLIAQKNQKLQQAKLMWSDLRLQMQQKCTACYELLEKKIEEYIGNMIERLQYEASHTNNPQKWWKEDFPYRSKIELTNMSVGIESIMSRKIGEDAHWYASAIEKTFRSYIICAKETISDKEFFGEFDIGGNLTFEDLDRQRIAFRIGTTVLSISGLLLFSAVGFAPVIASMGIGTSAGIISEQFFKNKIEVQREKIKEEIARCIPIFVQESMEESEQRLEATYRNIMNEAQKSEDAWFDAQQAMIDSIGMSEEDKTKVTTMVQSLEKLQGQVKRIDEML